MVRIKRMSYSTEMTPTSTISTTSFYSWVPIVRQRIEAERQRLLRLEPLTKNNTKTKEDIEIRRQRVLAQQAAIREQKLEIERQMAEAEARRSREEGERLEQARRLRLQEEAQRKLKMAEQRQQVQVV